MLTDELTLVFGYDKTLFTKDDQIFTGQNEDCNAFILIVSFFVLFFWNSNVIVR